MFNGNNGWFRLTSGFGSSDVCVVDEPNFAAFVAFSWRAMETR